ncbi:hypothetical protein R50073_07880 [Maricurvus nonylphenolicus]|uniref:hypothetical protein n=1 Tax=Maricurvus nonylphenolicus TaxID=1008307 RepID=UPI0036F2378C
MLSLAKPKFAENPEHDSQLIAYGDHRNNAMYYALPSEITAPNATPPVKLFYFASEEQGARLNLHLQLSYPEGDLSPLPVTDAWVQLHCALPLLADTDNSEATTQHYSTQWLPASLEQNQLNGLALELDITNTRVLHQLLTQEQVLPIDSIRVDIKLNFEGLRASFDQSLSFQPIEFYQHCQRLIEDWQQSLNIEEVPDFTSPPMSASVALNFIQNWLENSTTLAWLYEGLEEAIQDAQQEELILRLLEQGWQIDEQGGYQLLPLYQWQDLPDLGDSVDAYDNVSIRWNLQNPCKDTSQWLGKWSLSEYWLSLTEQQRQSIITSAPLFSPFSAVPIELSSLIPLNGIDITKLIAKLHYYAEDRQWKTQEISWQYNASNSEENTVPISQQLWGLVPQGDSFHCYSHYEIWFGLPPGGGWPLPPVRTNQQRLDTPYILLTPETLGLEFIRIEIQADAWSEDIAKIEVRLLSEQVTPVNTQAQHKTVNFLPSPYNSTSTHLIKVDQTCSRVPHYSHYQLILHPVSDQVAAITNDILPLPAERLLITSFHTQVITPTTINISVDESLWQNTETIILRLLPVSEFDPETPSINNKVDIRLLDPQNTSSRWLFWPSSRFNPNAFYWQTDIIALENDERITHSISWQFCQESQLSLNSTLLALPLRVTDDSTRLLTP